MLDNIVNYYWIVIILGLFRTATYSRDKNREKANLDTIIKYDNKKFIKYIKSKYFQSQGRLDEILNTRNEFKEDKFLNDFEHLGDKDQLLLSIKVEQTRHSFDTTGRIAIAIALLAAFVNLMPEALNMNSTRWESSVITIFYIVFALIFLYIESELSNVKANRAKLLKQYIDYHFRVNAEEGKKTYQKSIEESRESFKKELESISGDISKISESIERFSKNTNNQTSQPSLIKALLKLIFRR